MEDITITLSGGLIRGIVVVVVLLIVFVVGFGAGCSIHESGDSSSHDDYLWLNDGGCVA